jgi:hypothetical protein
VDRDGASEGDIIRRRMVRGEGDMILRVPVFRRDLGDKRQRQQVVDSRGDVSALVDGEGTILLVVSSG